ncbi:MAG: phage tail sheath family protein [Paraburkholderia sp.]|nr:MAG: phage tail sheath family protein [Paraburkholderia sp.]
MADGTAYSHPGVYIQELPGTPTISSVSTSIPVFIGATQTLDQSDLNVARLVSGWADYRSRYGDYVWGSEVSKTVYEFFAEGGTTCYVIGVTSTTQLAPAGNATIADTATGTYSINAASAGSWGKNLYISITDAGPTPPANTASNYFSVNVLVKSSDVKAAKPTMAIRLLKQYIIDNGIQPAGEYYVLESFGAFTSASVLGGGVTCKLAMQINAKSIFIRVANVTPASPGQKSGSRRGQPVQLSTGGTDFTLAGYSNAWPALSSVSDASLVATPDAAVADMTVDTKGKDVTDYKSVVITTGVLLTCQNAKLKNLFYVIDAPYAGISTNATGQVVDNNHNVVDFVLGTNDSTPLVSYENAGFYYPWPVVVNPVSGTNVPVPPSGPVTGCMARTDINAGVHFSPAGVVNGHIQTATGMTKWLSESDQDLCNPHGINVIRNVPGYGITIYGARTLAVGTEWQYTAVRRFVTQCELSLKAGLQWVVFEPNSNFLWTTIIREVSAYLSLLWNEGALFGNSPQEAFFVTCDETNNPPVQRTQGILNVDVGLAVLYPAEFVVIRLSQITAPSSGS